MIVLTRCAPHGIAGLGRTLSDVTDLLCGDGRPLHSFAGGVATGLFFARFDRLEQRRDERERRHLADAGCAVCGVEPRVGAGASR